MTKIKYIFNRIIKYYKRLNHIKYAKSLGVKVGDNCRFVDNPSWGSEPWLVSIGNHVLISGQVCFVTHDGSTFLFREEGIYKDTYKFGKIVVEDNCFIGLRSIILPNVKIGSNSIIAAGSVVSKSVPSGEVWGGVPAKFIMKTDAYAKNAMKIDYHIIQESLQQIKKKKC